MSNNINQDLETKIIHWGHSADPTTGALATPICQTATFAAKTVEHFEELCMTWGYVYTRECNPTLTELEVMWLCLKMQKVPYLVHQGWGQ